MTATHFPAVPPALPPPQRKRDVSRPVTSGSGSGAQTHRVRVVSQQAGFPSSTVYTLGDWHQDLFKATAAEELVQTKNALKLISGADGRTAPFALRKVRAALVAHCGAATARACLETNSLLEDSTTSSSSKPGRHHYAFTQHKPFEVSAGLARKLEMCPNQVQKPEQKLKGLVAMPSVGSHQSTRPKTSLAMTSEVYKESDQVRRGPDPKKHVKSGDTDGRGKKKLLSTLPQLTGRLARKVFEVKMSYPPSCDLAKSCRKKHLLDKLMRMQEFLRAVDAHSQRAEGINIESPQTLRRRSFSKGSAWHLGTGDDASSKKDPDQPVPSHANLDVFEAYELALKFNLPPGHVSNAWKLFKRYDANNDGMLAPYEFQMLLRAVLRERFPRAKDVPRELFKEAVEIQMTNVMVDFTDFLTWITQSSFNECLLVSEDQRELRRIARELGMDVIDIEAIKKRFDSFDTDGSGQLEFEEFGQLLSILFNLPEGESLPESRLKAFWRELDDDCSGVVDFQEFIIWYLSYLGGPGTTPLEEFYRNVRPMVRMQSD